MVEAKCEFAARDVVLHDGRTARLRALTTDDIDAFEWLAQAVIEDGRGVPQVPGESFASPERLARSWGDASGDVYVGAVLDGTLVGEGSLRRDRLVRVAHVAELGVSVHPNAQGVGLGRAITEALINWARGQSLHPLRRIELRVLASNDRATRLYESLGFVQEGRRRDYMRSIDGATYEDDLIMGLLL